MNLAYICAEITALMGFVLALSYYIETQNLKNRYNNDVGRKRIKI